MTINKIYDELKAIQNIAWKNDDYMGQDTLFELQDLIAELTLKVARSCKQEDDLINTFPWLYERKDK